MIFFAGFEAEKYVDNSLKQALLAFAHHEWPLHPIILEALFPFDGPPSILQMVSFGPSAPDGEKQVWTLTGQDIREASFPLPLDALGAAQRQPVAPVVYVIHEAVNNRAVGGMPSEEQLIADFENADKTDDIFTMFESGHRLNNYTGACVTKPDQWLCAALENIDNVEDRAVSLDGEKSAEKIAAYVQATQPAKSKDERTQLLDSVKPYLEEQDVPAVVLRQAAMARAGLKKSEAKTAELDKISAEALLKRALATDPYDPHAYVGLAQIYAANGAYEQSWDIYDALRAGIPTRDIVNLKVDNVEAKVQQNAAGFFLPE